MSLSAVVVPSTVVLPLPIGGWTITVREELNHGQHTAMLARMYHETDEGTLRVDALRTGDALILAYLVDWTLTDQRGQRIEIRGLKPDQVQDVLTNLRQWVAGEVKRAVEAHAKAVTAAAEEQKKTHSSGASLPETLPSAAPAA